jgi:hypothetical protein
VTDNEKGVVGQAIDAVSHAVTVLPPAFIVLGVLNVIFIAVTFYYLLVQQADRTALLRDILNTCTTAK